MNIETLRGFVKIVELHSVTMAAAALNIAQPALSRKIHALEEEFGQPIFLRKGRQLQLTSFGHKALQQAQTVLSEFDALEHLHDASNERRLLHVGTSLTTLSQFLPQIMAKFRTLKPSVDIIVHTGVSQEIYDMVGDGRTEIGLVSAPFSHRFIVINPLLLDSIWTICPADHPFSRLKAVTPADLDKVPLVTMTSYTILRQDLNAVFTTFNIKPHICMEIDNIDVIQRMVEANLGITLLPRSVWLSRPKSGSLVAIPFDVSDSRINHLLSRQFSIIHLDTPLSSEAKTWMSICQDVAAQLTNSY